MAEVLVKYPDLHDVAQKAVITYLRSIQKRSDKEIFDVTKLSIENFSASLGLPMPPKFKMTERKGVSVSSNAQKYEAPPVVKKDLLGEDLEEDDFALKPHEAGKEIEKSTKDQEVTMYGFHIPSTLFVFI